MEPSLKNSSVMVTLIFSLFLDKTYPGAKVIIILSWWNDNERAQSSFTLKRLATETASWKLGVKINWELNGAKCHKRSHQSICKRKKWSVTHAAAAADCSEYISYAWLSLQENWCGCGCSAEGVIKVLPLVTPLYATCSRQI